MLGGAPYVLEVGTPGVDRPLTERRHWSRARGRLVTVAVEGADVTGRVREVDDDGVLLEVDGAPRRLPWEGLAAGRVQIEFRRPDDDAADDPADDAATSATTSDDEHDEHDEQDEED